MCIIYTSGTVLAIRMGFFHQNAGGSYTFISWRPLCVFICNMLYTENVYKTVYNLQIKVRWWSSYIKKEIGGFLMKIYQIKWKVYRQNDFCWDKRFSPISKRLFLRYLLGWKVTASFPCEPCVHKKIVFMWNVSHQPERTFLVHNTINRLCEVGEVIHTVPRVLPVM